MERLKKQQQQAKRKFFVYKKKADQDVTASFWKFQTLTSPLFQKWKEQYVVKGIRLGYYTVGQRSVYPIEYTFL